MLFITRVIDIQDIDDKIFQFPI